jgi:hypothetical protein
MIALEKHIIEYFDLWNMMDWAGILLYIIGICLRLVSLLDHEETFNISRLYFTEDIKFRVDFKILMSIIY